MRNILLVISFIFVSIFSVSANSENENKVCSGFAKWTKNENNVYSIPQFGI